MMNTEDTERVARLRRRWFEGVIGEMVFAGKRGRRGSETNGALCVAEPEGGVVAQEVRQAEPDGVEERVTGFRYQRCGGGRRVIHKRIGGE